MKIRINGRKSRYLLMVLIALIVGMMFHIDRDMNMDFNRFQEIMDTIRDSRMGLFDFLSDKTNMLKWLNVTLPYMYSFDTLLYYISKHFSNNYVMVWVSVMIDYSIIAYIAYDWRRYKGYTQKEVVLSILICFAFLPMIHVCSGLRTATSSCFMFLAVYNYLYKDKGILNFALFSMLSITFHPLMLFAIPIALVVKLSTKRMTFYMMVLGCLFISSIADIFAKSSNVFLQSLATKYVTYTSEGQFRAYRFAMYGTIVFSLLAIAYYLLLYPRNVGKMDRKRRLLSFVTGTRDFDPENADCQKLFLFYLCYMALLVGNVRSYEMVCRGVYLVGASAPIIMDLLFNNSNKSKNKNGNVAVMIRICVVVLLLYICFKWIRYYYTYFVSFV